MTEPDPDYVPTLGFLARCIREDQIDGVYDALTGPEVGEYIAQLIDAAAERAENRRDEPAMQPQAEWTQGDWQFWRTSLARAQREVASESAVE